MKKRPDWNKRLVDVPMAKDAHDSIRHVAHDSRTTYGVHGDPENIGVNSSADMAQARRLDDDGYDYDGLNIVTGRTKRTKFSGGK